MKKLFFVLFIVITAILISALDADAVNVEGRGNIPVGDDVVTLSETSIDSCWISYSNIMYGVRMTIKPITDKDSIGSYGCRLSMPGYNYPSVDLGNDAGDYIIRSVDSLFVRKLVPPIVSEKYDSTVYCHVDGYSLISFYIFIGGKFIFKEFPFVKELGHYTYEFSDCFYELCDMICFNSRNYIGEYYYKDKSYAYISVDEMPEFPDGDEALLKWVHDNIRYPAAAKDSGLYGRVVVQFVVSRDGSIGNVKVVRSKGRILDEEAIRVVKSLPKFIPGKRRRKAVDVWYTLPVIFKPDSSAK